MEALGHESGSAPTLPRWPGQPNGTGDRASDLYRKLGGVQTQPRLAPGKWDLAFADLVVELDEELHFNRYRCATLSDEWTKALPWSADYRRFSAEYEGECIRAGSWGKRWTTDSAEAQFGPASEPKDLPRHGAPRWKQRALYDSMKDALADSGAVRLARLSVHDVVGSVTLDTILNGRAECDLDALAKLIERRIWPT